MEVADGHGENVTVRPSCAAVPDDEEQAIAECLRELSRRFVQARNCRPRKALFFHVEHRDRTTLIPIIETFVRRGSMVFTDQLATYTCLRSRRYRHYTVCHNNEFCHFVLEGPNITGV